jgi:uncharacterized membrane protein YebE (DUF533 family)
MAATEAMATWLGLLARGGVLDEAAEAGEAVAMYVVGEERVRELSAWFAEQTSDRVRSERRAAIELCIWMAHADRSIDPEERFLLRQLVAASGLDDDTQDELVESVHTPPPIDGIEERLTSPVLRELMLALAWELAMVDGRVSDEETALYADLAKRLAVSTERAAQIRAAVSEKIS